jgi:hypothetical protein
MENHNVVPLMGIENLRDYVRLERKAKNIILRVLSEEKDVDLEALSEIEQCLILLVKNINHSEVDNLEATDTTLDSSKDAVDDRRLKIVTSIRSMITLLKQTQESKDTPGPSGGKSTHWVPRVI